MLTEGARQGGSRASSGSFQDFSALHRSNSRMSALNWRCQRQKGTKELIHIEITVVLMGRNAGKAAVPIPRPTGNACPVPN